MSPTRRILLATLLALTVVPSLGWIRRRGMWGIPNQSNQAADDAQLRQQIQEILKSPRQPGMDDWSWRDTVEDQLVALGGGAAGTNNCIYLMQLETEARQGYELDALRVAVFRLENDSCNPRQAIEAWSNKNFPNAPSKLTRVMGEIDLLPHHLFYVFNLKATHTRIVLAVAADTKVQPLPDDAALTKFLRIEMPPAITPTLKQKAAAAAALLALSRITELYQIADLQQELEPLAAQATLTAQGHRLNAKVTFDPAQRIASITTKSDTTPEPAYPPIAVPEARTPPPPIPG